MNYFLKKNMIIFVLIILLSVILIVYFTCSNYHYRRSIESDHKEIKAILDEALLSSDPIKSFNEVLPKIKNYTTVDSVWISRITFYVKYKKGGIVSWSVSPDKLKK